MTCSPVIQRKLRPSVGREKMAAARGQIIDEDRQAWRIQLGRHHSRIKRFLRLRAAPEGGGIALQRQMRRVSLRVKPSPCNLLALGHDRGMDRRQISGAVASFLSASGAAELLAALNLGLPWLAVVGTASVAFGVVAWILLSLTAKKTPPAKSQAPASVGLAVDAAGDVSMSDQEAIGHAEGFKIRSGGNVTLKGFRTEAPK